MSNDFSSGEKTESITFRLDKYILDKLRSQSKKDGTSLNSLVNQLLSHAVDWDIVASKAGWFTLPKYSFISILDKLDEKTITELGERIGHTLSKDMPMKMRGGYGISEWISVLKSRARASGFGLNEVAEEDHISFVTQHDMGIKASIWFKSFYAGVFNDLGKSVKFEYTENTVVYKVNKKDLV